MITNIPDRMSMYPKFYYMLGIMLIVPNIMMMIIAIPVGIVLVEFEVFTNMSKMMNVITTVLFVYGLLTFITTVLIGIRLMMGKTKVTFVDNNTSHKER